MTLATESEFGAVDAVIYARVSSAAQVSKGHGIQSQITRCEEFARMKRYHVRESFKDEAVSGSMIDRSGMKAMLRNLRQHRRSGETVVLIDDISRLARDLSAHLALRVAISEAGGRLESPSIEFGEDSDSILVENLLASVSQHHRQKHAELTKNRQRARILNGYWPFKACPGYRFEKSHGEGKVLVQDEPLATIIAKGMEGFASGHFQTRAELKRYFESVPAFPKTRHRTVTNENVNRILNRVIYAGYVEAPDWSVSLRPGKHEGLISLETFEKIQARLKESTKAPARPDISEAFPLRGFVCCDDCNGAMTACWSTSKTGKRHPYYMCFAKGCESYRKSIPRAKIENEFETLLQSLQPTLKLFEVVRAMFKDAWEQQRTHAKAMTQSLKRQLDKCEQQVSQLLDRIVEASNPRVVAAYEERIAALEREKLVLVERLQSGAKPPRPFEEMFELSMRFLASPWSIWENGELPEKQTVLKLAFADRLAYSRNGGFRTPQPSVIFGTFQRIGANAMMAVEAVSSEPVSSFYL